MNLGRESMMDLMAYADGELEGEALARIEALVARDAEAAKLVEELRTLTTCVQVAEKGRRVPKSVDRIVDSVMENVSRAAPPPAFEPKVVKMKRAVAAGTVSAVLAMAAAWAMFLRAPPAGEVGSKVASVPPAVSVDEGLAAPPRDPAEALAQARPGEDPAIGGVELEQVESPREVSIFYVPAVAAAHASSVVVWIGDMNKGTD